ncbi:glycosyltransferase family 4 protein [Spirosoma knui]
MNVGIIFPELGPYHIARIQSLRDALLSTESTLLAFRFSSISNTYNWQEVDSKDIEVVTLSESAPAGFLQSYKVAYKLIKNLKSKNIEVIFLPSYSPLPNLLCLLGAKFTRCKTILMNESWHGTEKANILGRLLKHFVVRLFDAALVGGTPQVKYACAYGQKPSHVFMGYDAVDVDYFSQQAVYWSTITDQLPINNLPKRYFLNLGRFVSKKNLSVLIRAYARLASDVPSLDVGLVLVGEGPDEEKLRNLATSTGLLVVDGLATVDQQIIGPHIVFYPFQQIDKTPLFLSRCEAFILPSLYEEWGLVVNEAMACGTPVLVSENVGSAYDLVLQDVNGYTFNPSDVDQLYRLLKKFVTNPELSKTLGINGREHIKNWGLDLFAQGALSAINAATK